jgi:transposase
MPDRTALSGILYVLRQQIRWRILPAELGYGSGTTCYKRLRKWEREGIWQPVELLLRQRLSDGEQLDWSKLLPDLQRPLQFPLYQRDSE